MIMGEAAQGMVPDDASSPSAGKDSSTQVPASAQPQPSGVLGVAAAAASAGARNVRKLSSAAAGALPQGWQLQKWPTEDSELLPAWGLGAARVSCLHSACVPACAACLGVCILHVGMQQLQQAQESAAAGSDQGSRQRNRQPQALFLTAGQPSAQLAEPARGWRCCKIQHVNYCMPGN